MVRLLPVLLSALLTLLSLPSRAAPPALEVPDQPLGVPGAGLPLNLLLNFAVNGDDAGAAYREPYRATRAYAGYFNARLCYQYDPNQYDPYPPAQRTATLADRSGLFSPAGRADPRHDCRAAFSGNFLNWASMSPLDLLRYALTGGDRVIDEPGMTVVQRAWLPDQRLDAGFYANPGRLPRKMVVRGADGGDPAHVTPFSADRLYLGLCGNRLLIATSSEGSQCRGQRVDPAARRPMSDKLLGEFTLRVRVCTADDAALRPDLCARYRGGYKPQGVLQQADHPVGVMAYLSEPGAADSAGALRAPIKALGGDREWDPDTGVLARNPDSAAAGISGAINVVNRLGRGNDKQPGAYSRGDAGAELYYEALRYLQGRPASNSAGAAQDDGLPVWRKAADPIEAGCQRTIVATVGHAAFSKDRFVPGNTVSGQGHAARPTDAFAALDVMHSTRRVGQMEAASGAGPASALAQLDTAVDGVDGSYYLAGAAHWAHTNPIRPNQPVRVDSFSLQLGASAAAGAAAAGAPTAASAASASTGRVESALYYAAKYGAFDDRNGDGNPHVSSAGQEGDEWSDGNGKPRHWYPAPHADDIIPAVRALFADAGAHAGVVAGPATLGGAGEGRYLIQTSYDAARWSGSVQRRSVRLSSDGVEVAATPAWDAAQMLGPSDERNIYTLVRPRDGAERTVPFTWSALPAELRVLFDEPGDKAAGKSVEAAAKNVLGPARISYLRGDRALEAGPTNLDGRFRRRTGALGDIVRSIPLIVAAPSIGGQGPGYAEFRERSRGRPPAVYVGANDGMLHAFDAASGRELFAYVPNALLPDLAQLTTPAYRHRAYVDGSPAQGEAMVRGRWRSVLASGMGMGARGLFALDVTQPGAFAAGMGALWEFTERDDPAIGHIGTPPRIVKLNVAIKDGVPQYRHFVVAASGINPAGGAGRGALFLLSLDKPPEQKWQLGVNYYRFLTPAGDTGSANALSPPALALAGDGSARYAYAGDLQGRLWRFDLGGKPPWGGTLARPLFVARDGQGRPQPIAHAPALVFAPGGGYLVMFATGRFIERADAAADSFTAQSFYAIHDRLEDGADPVGGRGALQARSVSGKGPYTIKGKPVGYSGAAAKRGWYVDFANPGVDGERAAGSPVVQSGAVLFDTLLPALDGCGAPGRRSYVLDALSGMALGADGTVQPDAASGELVAADDAPTSVVPGAPLLMKIGTSTGARNATGTALATRKIALVRLRTARTGEGNGGASASARTLNISFAARRLSWREIGNWKDLHEKAKR